MTSHERQDNPDFLDVLMASGTNGGDEGLTMANIKGLLLVMIRHPFVSSI